MHPSDRLSPTFQAQFHSRWHHLTDPHVRALAWLLDSPDLLNPHAPQWEGKIATLSGCIDQGVRNWLVALDAESTALHAYLDVQPFTRLGRYAEKLMAFYFRYRQILVAHGVQVQVGKNETIGEFDFLLRQADALVHWEFATKFYLFAPDCLSSETSDAGDAAKPADYFVGPNLADTLGAKMHKILDRQLSLGSHPSASPHLPQPLAAAQALIKGWLFYHGDNPLPDPSSGVSATHCRGFWCSLSELDGLPAERYATLPRLGWLAPAQVSLSKSSDRQVLQDELATHFRHDTMPVLVALVEPDGDCWIEASRGFVVPNDWRKRVAQRV